LKRASKRASSKSHEFSIRVASRFPVNGVFMDTSVKALEEAISIRRRIDSLEKRLSAILSGSPARRATAGKPKRVPT
jgi:hypothetical protein